MLTEVFDVRIGELAKRASVTIKAVRYYEQLGLITATRRPNGYREYSQIGLRLVQEIRNLGTYGIGPAKAAPFIDCLRAGHQHSDDCPASLASYRNGIAELDSLIRQLTERREQLRRLLEEGANRTRPGTTGSQPASETTTDYYLSPIERTAMAESDYTQLPEGLPIPVDDGAADHLPGTPAPALRLPTSDGQTVDLAALPGRTIVYLYPLTGQPGVDLPEGWDSIPGARGCSTEACDFRDHFADLQEVGVDRVFGMSSQSPAYQQEVVERLHLPFAMISDEHHQLGDALSLPRFSAPEHDRLYSRLTLVVDDGVITHAFYPIFPPNTHAQQVVEWASANRRVD